MPNTIRAEKACTELWIEYSFLDINKNILEYNHNNTIWHLIQGCVPTNNEIFALICKDKGFMYDILKDKIQLPTTLQYLDPASNSLFMEYMKYENIEKIVEDIEKKLSYPIIIKKSRWSLWIHVFKCDTTTSLTSTIRKIFDNQKNYDYICLAQEYIHIKKEYRVIVYNNEVQFSYIKDNTFSTEKENLSPLHQHNSIARLEKDNTVINMIKDFVGKLSTVLPLPYTWIDLALDENGVRRLIELNSHPGFSYFVRDNWEKEVIDLYKKIILSQITPWQQSQ